MLFVVGAEWPYGEVGHVAELLFVRAGPMWTPRPLVGANCGRFMVVPVLVRHDPLVSEASFVVLGTLRSLLLHVSAIGWTTDGAINVAEVQSVDVPLLVIKLRIFCRIFIVIFLGP